MWVAAAVIALLVGGCADRADNRSSAAAAARAPGTPVPAPPARRDLYACEGCEAALERSAAPLSWTARIAAAGEPGEPLVVRGRVLDADARQPLPNVVIYAYQTSARGLYEGGVGTGEARRHGRLRGWVRTGADGRYEFTTIKPAPYPNDRYPAHIHLTVAEPGKRPYWIDDVVFAGEFGVDQRYRREREDRGGSGIVQLQRMKDGRLLAKRTIVLERHPS